MVRKKEALTFWTITAAIGLPMILAVALVSMDMRTDLSELKSTGQPDGNGAVPVGWQDLAQHSDKPGRVRMVGYMMDERPTLHDGTRVDTFILLPEAGQFLHPAHRIPNQMVVVWPNYPVVFRYRELVWASGVLNRTLRRLRDDQPAYSMIFAEVSPAAERDIGTWFRP